MGGVEAEGKGRVKGGDGGVEDGVKDENGVEDGKD